MKKFERKSQPLLTRREFARRMALYTFFALGFLCLSLVVGTAGYAYFANLATVDAFLNASMILTGMGPVDKMETTAGKLFAGIYAIYSGVAFLTFCGVLFTPVYHRFMHKFHLELADEADADNETGVKAMSRPERGDGSMPQNGKDPLLCEKQHRN